ncbi:sensor domain-containing protein [Psychrobacillus antarcticus]|uniref:sensor domain-containing protein n=1 Tax=Psychrobacillus antarcticus TaxID=2879115 RepID=UPI002408605C|nr:sensor domain-containing diguanylate cyclase [Psychrobacillus antarcticus]
MERFFNNISIDMYRFLISNNPDAIFLLDENGHVLDINSAATNIFGYTIAERTKLHYQSILVPNAIYNVKRLFLETLQGESCAYEAQAYRKNGNILHLKVKNIPMLDNGKIFGVMIIAKDVTELVQTKVILQETTERLHSLLYSSADAIDLIDTNGNILTVNRAFEEMYGWKVDELVGKPLPTIPMERMDAVFKQREELKNGQHIKGFEATCLKKDGSTIEVSITLSPLHNESGEVVAFSGISRDITERKVLLENLVRSEEKYRLIAENMTDLVLIIDENGKTNYVSPSYFTVLGIPLMDFEGTYAMDFVHPDDLPKVLKVFKENISTKGSANVVCRLKHKTKSWLWVEAKASYFIDEEHGKPFLLVVSRDFEEKKQLREELKLMAFHDSLTGLPNRRLFEEKMQQSLKEAKRHHQKCALLYLDIDKFKWVNDNLGHSTGDELLKLFAQRVSKSIRNDDILARQGGDEFTILLSHIENEEDARTCAERILESLQQVWEIGEHHFETTSSIGIALYPQDGDNIDKLFTNADYALYEAKKSGRNTYRLFTNE